MHHVSIRATSERDSASLSVIHCQALTGSLLARLGAAFLQNVFYPELIKRHDVIAFTLLTDCVPAGFAIYGKTLDVLPNILKSMKFKIAATVMQRIFIDPMLLWECLFANKGEVSVVPSGAGIHLGFIAISPHIQGEGLGSDLLLTSGNMAMEHFGIPCINVETRTQRALRFYLRNGFVHTGSKKRGSSEFYCLRFPE
jgi:GNAT superfamily N-acetyltransferase